jgi:hypothetical protein
MVHSVNQTYYVETFKWLREAVRRKSLNFGPVIRFSTTKMLQFTMRSLPSSFWPKYQLLKWKTHPIPLIWLRMTSSCFQKTKSALKGSWFENIKDVQKHVTTALKAILHQEFQKCFQQWQQRWATWEYFEGDPSQWGVKCAPITFQYVYQLSRILHPPFQYVIHNYHCIQRYMPVKLRKRNPT